MKEKAKGEMSGKERNNWKKKANNMSQNPNEDISGWMRMMRRR